MSTEMIGLFLESCLQTALMVIFSCTGAVIVGAPLGVVLLITRNHHLLPHARIHKILGLITNGVRSIPFIILMVAIIPFTRFIVGTSIGTAAATVPLMIAAIPFVGPIGRNGHGTGTLGISGGGTVHGSFSFSNYL